MMIGESLIAARKKSGLTQEEVAEKLNVSRQTISKWETSETVPDICQGKLLATLYQLSLDELMNFDSEIQEIEHIIKNINEEKHQQLDWTSMWGKRYPVLTTYTQDMDISYYVQELCKLLSKLKSEQGYNDLDTFLVLKDILGKIWKNRNK